MRKLLFGFVILLAIVIGFYPVTYLIPALTDSSFLNTKSTLNSYYWALGFKTHIVSSGIALLTGWLQFIKKFRVRAPRIHRLIGYVFFAAVFIGGVSGLYLAFYSNYIFSKSGFGILSILWLYTSFSALYYISKRQFVQHYHWALRTYAITLAAVTFRLCFIVLTVLTNNYEASFSLSSWLCWIINVAIVELFIQWSVSKDAVDV